MRPIRAAIVPLLVASLAVACGGTDGGAAGPGAGAGGMDHGAMDHGAAGVDRAAGGTCRADEDGVLALVAEGLAFDATCLAVPAGAPFAIAFENRDGAPHNVTIEDASGQLVFDGANVGQGVADYEVPALEAGTYPFHCHVHPDMAGVLRVG